MKIRFYISTYGHTYTNMALVPICKHQFGWHFFRWLFWCILTFCLLEVISPNHSLFDLCRVIYILLCVSYFQTGFWHKNKITYKFYQRFLVPMLISSQKCPQNLGGCGGWCCHLRWGKIHKISFLTIKIHKFQKNSLLPIGTSISLISTH